MTDENPMTDKNPEPPSEKTEEKGSPFPEKWWEFDKWNWDALVEEYAKPPYLIVIALWAFAATNYFPLVFHGYYRMLEDLGGPLLAIPVVYLLALIPIGVFFVCIRLVKKGKDGPARMLAIAPAVLAFMTFHGFMFSMVGTEASMAKKEYFESRQEEQLKELQEEILSVYE